MSVDRTKMAMTTTFDDLKGSGFLCRLCVDSVVVATASATNKKLAKHAAFVAASEVSSLGSVLTI